MNNTDFFSFLDPQPLPSVDNPEELVSLFAATEGDAETSLELTDLFPDMGLEDPANRENAFMEAGLDLESLPPGNPTEVMPDPAETLVPPLWRDHQALVEQLARKDIQLAAYQRRLDSTEDLIQQQATALTQLQDQLAHAVAELAIHQEQSVSPSVSEETLAAVQTQLSEVQGQLQEAQISLQARQTHIEQLQTAKTALETRVATLEQQLTDLQPRLQRQQRYASQYKAALEHCLAQPDFHPSSDIRQVVARLIGQPIGRDLDPQPLTNAPIPVVAAPLDRPSKPLVKAPPVADKSLSFAVSAPPERKKPPSRAIDLPQFLPRTVTLS